MQTTFQKFQWLNESRAEFKPDSVVLYAPPRSDYFYHDRVEDHPAATPGASYSAPFFHTRVTGDFVMRVKVSLEFKETFDSASIMVMRDLAVWAKACFERTEYKTNAAVSVVTDHVSDDANGANVEGGSLWLQAARKGDRFAFHYSADGETYFMMRYFTLPAGPEVMVGFVPQSPIGPGGSREYAHFSLEYKTVENLRAGK